MIDHARDVIGQEPVAPPAAPVADPATTPPPDAESPWTVLEALGVMPFTEELRGNFAIAAERADRLLASVATNNTVAFVDALLSRAWVYLLQGEIAAARPLLEQAWASGGDDANVRLRVVSQQLMALQHQFNLSPDRSGVGSNEVSTRWGGAKDLIPLDAQWNEAYAASTNGNAQFEGWVTYQFIVQQLAPRYMLDTRRFTPSGQALSEVMGVAVSRTERLRQIGTTLTWPSLRAYADVVEADLQRRAGDLPAAQALLQRAEAEYVAAGDVAGHALCIMTRTDWECATFSTPVSWNFALVDSSGPSNTLTAETETLEYGDPPSAERRAAALHAYDQADALFHAARCPRGRASIDLRRGYLAATAHDWPAAAAHASAARDAFTAAGDQLNATLAATHLLMAELSGAGTGVDTWQLATDIGAWGAASGSFSFALGCGVLVCRLARHWLVRGAQSERAIACSTAARALYQSLGASVNAAQCLVDMGLMHSAVGLRTASLTSFEAALDEYAALVETAPAIASNLRERIVLLSADVYQLALQNTDADAMERSAARLGVQLKALPTSTSLMDTMQAMQARMEALAAGHDVPDAPLPDLDALMTLAPLGQLAQSIVHNAAVLAPLYRARTARAVGDLPMASRWLQQATGAIAQVRDGERDMLHAVVLAEKDDYPAAADAMRAYIRAGGANAGVGGEITQVMGQMGGDAAAAELALQERRTHEQAFTAFVMVRAYDDAAEHLEALERMAGVEWWRHDRKPWQPLCNIAELCEQRGDIGRARRSYDMAVSLLEERRALLSRDELKVALASDKGSQYLYLLSARAAVQQGDLAAGFGYAERAKSRALLDLMAVSRAPVPGAEGPEMQAWREQGMQLQVTRGLLAQARSVHTPDAARITSIESQLREHEAQHREAERALAAVHPRFLEAVSSNATVLELEAVRQQLPPGALLLEYFFTGEDLLAWAVSRDRAPVVHHVAIDTMAIARDVRELHTAIDAFTPWQPSADRLASILLQPFAVEIAAVTDLLIVPHGPTHLLPFQVLSVNGAMLADTHTLSYLPSASVLQWLPLRAVESTPERILVVGNPTDDLPASVREAQFVAEQFPQATLLLSSQATEAVVRAVIPHVTLVHFATHGIIDAASSLNSALSLAGGDELTVYELMLLRLRAQLVVLGACSTGKGETTGGDDVLGLTRALLAAGAEAAVVSLWQVDDHATALFMQAFYAGLARGAAPRVAMQEAQTALRRMTMDEIEERTRGQRRSPGAAAASIPEDEGGYRNPYFWAPFVLVGR